MVRRKFLVLDRSPGYKHTENVRAIILVESLPEGFG